MSVLKSALASLAGVSRQVDATGIRSATRPDATDTWSLALREGRLHDALAAVDAAIEAQPDAPRLRRERARILRAWGRIREALDEVERARGEGDAALVDPADARLIAWHARSRGSAAEAVAASQTASERAPGDAETATELGSAFVMAGRVDDAAATLDRALNLDPRHVDAYLGLAHVRLLQGREAEAESIYRRALDVDGAHPVVLRHLAVLLARQDRLAEATPYFDRAEAAWTSDADYEPAVARGIVMCHAGRVEDGAAVLAKTLPDHPDLHGYMQIAAALIALGDFETGWRQFEHRWLVPPLATIRADYGVPQWTGQPLEGHTILVRAEQGIGDMFQLARYLPLLQARGARVIYQPLQGMDAVARRFPGIDHVARDGELLPDFGYYVNAMSLPMAFGTTLDKVPGEVPYVSPDPAYVEKWAARLGPRDKPRVGIVWAGRPAHLRDRERSLRLEQLAAVLAVPGVRFVSLQKGPAVAQAEWVPESVDWTSLGPELDELDDAVAVLSMLDLVIGVDTGPMHIAGALGKPAWMLLPSPPDYRWLLSGEDSPWYPTLRLFRQTMPKDWGPVIERTARELAQWVEGWDARSRPAPAPAKRLPLVRGAIPGTEQLATSVDTCAGILIVSPADPLPARSLERYGEWLRPRLDVALAFVRPGAVVLEAAAGIGAHAVPLARAAGASGMLLAYESRPPLRRLLAQNFAVHDILTATVMRRALGARWTADGCESIDDLRLARLDGIKVNEGTDPFEILRGASETLWRCRPWLLFGSADSRALDRARGMLRDFGYRAWHMETPLFSPANFNRRDDDVFAGATAHALFALPEELDLRVPLPGCREWT